MKIDTSWNVEFAKVREGTEINDNGFHMPYECPAGKLTIGYGHNIEDNGIDENTAKSLLRVDIMDAQEIAAKNIEGWEKCNSARKSVLIDMCFNMGWPKFSTFKKMLAAINDEDWEKAAAEMKDSKWYRQVGIRAKALNKMMLSGYYPD